MKIRGTREVEKNNGVQRNCKENVNEVVVKEVREIVERRSEGNETGRDNGWFFCCCTHLKKNI